MSTLSIIDIASFKNIYIYLFLFVSLTLSLERKFEEICIDKKNIQINLYLSRAMKNFLWLSVCKPYLQMVVNWFGLEPYITLLFWKLKLSPFSFSICILLAKFFQLVCLFSIFKKMSVRFFFLSHSLASTFLSSLLFILLQNDLFSFVNTICYNNSWHLKWSAYKETWTFLQSHILLILQVVIGTW